MKQFKFAILVLLAIIALALGQVIKQQSPGNQDLPSLTLAPQPSDWQRGPNEALATVVVYTDLACATCAELNQKLDLLSEDSEKPTRVIYRHFASASSTASRLAAAAAEAAGKQNKFWPMFDLLFERQAVWVVKEDPSDLLLGYAASLHLNLARFKRDMASAAVKEKIEADYQSGVNSGVNLAPAVFLNGARIDRI